VTVRELDGSEKRFFLKLALNDHGRQLLHGEFTAISTLYELIPDLVPKPLAWGKYSHPSPEIYFFIEDFRDLDMSLPSPQKLVRRVLQMHSLTSPNGKFGFPVTTFDGIAPHITEWNSSWTSLFARLLSKSVEVDRDANGDWPELTLAAERVVTIVVPRLLDPLQQGPNPIVPRLIHGDLWSGNIGEDEETGELMFVDAGSFYAHNELDIGMWRRYGKQNFGQRYLDEYNNQFPPADPQNEFDDRNRLYSLKFDLNHSAGNPGDKARNVVLNNMIYLCTKYASGDDLPQYDPGKDPSFAGGKGYIYAK
jgi:protein-ribulosamine 3-kinase